MSLLRMNYTGRIDIESQEVSATYRVDNGQYVLTIKWLLGHYGMNKDCQLFVGLEGDGTSESRRFDLGKLGDGQGEGTLTIAQVRNPDLIKIRLKVVELSHNGVPLIKAQCDKISPLNIDGNNRSRSFLKIVKRLDLTVPWLVEFEEDEPTLVISDRDGLYHKLRDTSPIFMPLVLAEVVRQVFVWLATTDVDYNDDILTEWILLFERLTCPHGFIQAEHALEDEDEMADVERVAKDVSEEFAKKFNLIEKVSSTFEDGEALSNA